MKYRLITMTLLALSATAAAQTPQPFKLEVRPFVGAFVPTGQARDDFEKASMAGMQGAIEFSPSLHVLCSMFWTQTDAKFTGTTDPTTYVLQYDMGVEYTPVIVPAGSALLRPFVGAGAGGRTYDYKAPALDTKSCSAGYGAVGSEVQSGRLALRVEARDYVNCFESPVSGRKSTRNDVALSAGLAIHLW